MNRLIAVVLLGLSLMVSPLMVNVAIASQVGVKIGVVDMERVASESSAGQQAKQAIDHKTRQFQLDTERKRASLEKFKQELDKERVSQNKEEIERKTHYLAEKMQVFQLQFQQDQQELEEFRNRQLGVVRDKTLRAVNAIAKSEGFSHVFATNAMLWSDSAHDLTDKVIPRAR
jgi:outer membrane protein